MSSSFAASNPDPPHAITHAPHLLPAKSQPLIQPMRKWNANSRVLFVLLLSFGILGASAFLRLRVHVATSSLYPDYLDSQLAPLVQTFREISWFGLFSGVWLAVTAIHRWLQLPPEP